MYEKDFFLFTIIMLVISIITACSSDGDNLNIPENEPQTAYEVKSDIQQPMSVFIENIPEEYAAFKAPMANAVSLREKAIAQEIGNPDIKLGFRKITYLYPSTDANSKSLKLSAVAFWLGYFDNGFTEEMVYSQNYLAVKSEIDNMIADKQHDTSAINRVFIEKVRKTVDETLADDEIYLADILSLEMLDKESPICKALYQCLEKNDLTKGWTPVHPMTLHYSTRDMVVPQENSLAMLEAFGENIVTLNKSPLPVDHTTTCSLWMVNLLSSGF